MGSSLLYLSSRLEALSLYVIITGIFPIFHWPISVWFDPRSTYSYVHTYFSDGFDLLCERMFVLVHTSTPIRDPLVVDRVSKSCLLSLAGNDTWMDMIILDMVDFKVILGMDWLSPYHVILDYNTKIVTLAILVG